MLISMMNVYVVWGKVISALFLVVVCLAFPLVQPASYQHQLNVLLVKMAISGVELNVFKRHLVVQLTMDLIVQHVLRDPFIMEMESVKQLVILMSDIIHYKS